MRQTIAAITMILAAGSACGQELAVGRATIWTDSVKKGSKPVRVRGLGVLTARRTAELRIPESGAKRIMPGQTVSLDMRPGILSGSVMDIDRSMAEGMVTVEVKIEGDLPATARPGTALDGTINIATLNDVIYVGRPVDGKAESEGMLFKLEPDGQHALRVKVQYGLTSVNLIEIRAGLQPGDQVILSDMSAFDARERVRLQ
jgi:HlyD family secretion protein